LIVDTSAIVAVILKEPGSVLLVGRLEASPEIAIGSPTLFETEMVLSIKLGERGRSLLSLFLEENGIAVLPFGGNHALVATQAFLRFGKGRHPARLNYGDCMTYATARLAGAPLLFVGDDFHKSDIIPALASRTRGY
jgi:ribonuclease VapC